MIERRTEEDKERVPEVSDIKTESSVAWYWFSIEMSTLLPPGIYSNSVIVESNMSTCCPATGQPGPEVISDNHKSMYIMQILANCLNTADNGKVRACLCQFMFMYIFHEAVQNLLL